MDEESASEVAPATGSQATPARARVIFADDSPSVRRVGEVLLGRDYEVEACDDGDTALAAAERLRPDVVVSDLRMPRMDGRELLRRLRARPATRSVPFILITGEGEEALYVEGAEADDFIAKPFTPEELRARVAAALRSFRLYLALEAKHEELQRIHEASARLELELRSAQKLEAVGRLAGGIAHEINTPVQFLTDNTGFLADAFTAFVRVLEARRAAVAGLPGAAPVEARLAAVEEEVELPYLLEQLPRVFPEMREGLRRIGGIVAAMKEFASADQKELVETDLNRAVRATLEVARNEYKYVAEVEAELGPLPAVACHPGEINQVLLGLIVNAAQAVGDVVKGTKGRGRIRVRTAAEGGLVRISISDTGPGIPAAAREHIFEPFFTTRQAGRGRGLGLATARRIVEQHRGALRFETAEGRGTTFHLELPAGPAPAAGGAPP